MEPSEHRYKGKLKNKRQWFQIFLKFILIPSAVGKARDILSILTSYTISVFSPNLFSSPFFEKFSHLFLESILKFCLLPKWKTFGITFMSFFEQNFVRRDVLSILKLKFAISLNYINPRYWIFFSALSEMFLHRNAQKHFFKLFYLNFWK